MRMILAMLLAKLLRPTHLTLGFAAFSVAAIAVGQSLSLGGSWPEAPTRVNNAAVCHDLQKALEAKVDEINAAHGRCLAMEDGTSVPGMMTVVENASRCSKPKCQNLHNELGRIATHFGEEVGICHRRLASSKREAPIAGAQSCQRCYDIATEQNLECPMEQPEGAACHLVAQLTYGSCMASCSQRDYDAQ
jgi:hypothetical protein